MTAAWRNREELAHQVALLAKQGEPRRAIARALGVSRNTVRTLLAAHAQDRTAEQVAISPRPKRAPRAAKILLLRERYGTDEIDRALGHAAAFGARDHATVERILAARALPRSLDEYVAEDTARRIEEALGHARTVPRDLTEYDRLPLTSASRSRTEETTPSRSPQRSPPGRSDPATGPINVGACPCSLAGRERVAEAINVVRAG